MTSKIESMIDEIENYINDCKFMTLSTTKIIVNKEEFLELLRELRAAAPDEIKRYQKIISNKDAILNDAKQKAEALLNDTKLQTTQLINEHEIMQQAYAKANEVITTATKKAQDILDNSTIEANSVKASAMQYTDDLLANLENIITQSANLAASNYEELLANLNSCNAVVKANRTELNPAEDDDLENIIFEDSEDNNGNSSGLNVI